jgi:glucose/arabinose dehydrogenase
MVRAGLFSLLAISLLLGTITPIAAQDPEATPEATPVASPVAEGTPIPVEEPPVRTEDMAPEGTPLAAQPSIGGYPGPNSISLMMVTDQVLSPRVIVSSNDGTGRLFIGERHGKIKILTPEGEVLPEPFLDLGRMVLTGHQDQGLIGIAFHPDYAENGLFYVAFTEFNTNGALAIVQLEVSPDDPNRAVMGSLQDIIKIAHPTTILNGGTIHFGPDGYLYIASGNGAFFGVHDIFSAQTFDNHLGKILRLGIENVDGVASYFIPPDNPYNMSFAYWNAQHVWALGLRNPWQFSFDPETGDMYVPDVGEMTWEEINFIPAGSKGGQNFGWPIWEGMHCFNFYTTGSCAQTGTPPIATYLHGEEGCAVTGIGVYRGTTVPFLNGMYLSGDYCVGKIRALYRDSSGAWQFEELLNTTLLITGGGQDDNGELYVMSCECGFGEGVEGENPGVIWRVVAAGQAPEGSVLAPLDEDD